MKIILRTGFLIGLMAMLFTASCASTKTLNVWKDEGHSQKLGKTLVIAIAELDYMRDHFENVLALRLGDSGIKRNTQQQGNPSVGRKSRP